MRRRLVPLLLVALSVGCFVQWPRFAAGGVPPAMWCVPDTGLMARIMFDGVAIYASSPGEIPTAARQRLGVPLVSLADVARVVEEADCERASRAVAAQYLGNDAAGRPRLEPVSLFRVGPRWVAVPRDSWLGEWAPVVHFDSTFRKLGVQSL